MAQHKFVIKNGLIAAGMTYPTSDGSNGQTIVTDGAGNLTFSTSTSGLDSASVTSIVNSSISSLQDSGEVQAIVNSSIADLIPTASGVTAGTYGSATSIPVFTVDEFGVVDSAGEIGVSGITGVAYDSASGVLTISTSGDDFLDSNIGLHIDKHLPLTGGTISGDLTLTGYLGGPATFTIDPAGIGDNTGTVVIAGDLQVDGTTTTVNSTTMDVDDVNITVAKGAANAAAANGGGITVDGANASILYGNTSDNWIFNKAPYYNTDRILTTADEGTGNGLDADTLDGQEGTYYRINVYNSAGTLLN